MVGKALSTRIPSQSHVWVSVGSLTLERRGHRGPIPRLASPQGSPCMGIQHRERSSHLTFSVSAVATAGSFQPQACGSPLYLQAGHSFSWRDGEGDRQRHWDSAGSPLSFIHSSFQEASDRRLVKKMCQPATTRSVNITPTACNEGHGIRQNQTALGELALWCANNKGRSMSG